MASDSRKNHKNVKGDMQKERRSFLKKTAYATPILIVLGQLTKPTNANAEYTQPNPWE